jgi:hypothetical protein
MALQLIELKRKKFLYRCDDCAFMHPKKPVPRDELGRPPEHDCPNANRVNSDDIVGIQR